MGLHGSRLGPILVDWLLDVARGLLVSVPVELLGVLLCLVLSACLVELVPVLTWGGKVLVDAAVIAAGLLRHAGGVHSSLSVPRLTTTCQPGKECKAGEKRVVDNLVDVSQTIK